MRLTDKIWPMLAYPSDPFDSPNHLFEIKWDGTRCILFAGKEIRLQNRRLENITRRYPEMGDARGEITAETAILDGELVIIKEGKSDFNKLQQREHLGDRRKIEMLSGIMPATYVAFDILHAEGRDLLGLPLTERKEILSHTLSGKNHILESRWITEKGTGYFKAAIEHGLEGVMAKRLSSTYLLGKRSCHWLKIKAKLRRVCTIIGFEGESSLSALLVATREGSGLVYRGKVGTGFTMSEREDLLKHLVPLQTTSSPIPGLKRPSSVHWVQPELMCEVQFQEETEGGRFRAPAFKRMME